MDVFFLTISWPKYGYNLYSDLMDEFVAHGHRVFVATASEMKHKTNTFLTEEKGIKILNIKCGNIKKENKINKAFGLATIDYFFKKAINKYWGDINIDLIIMSTPPVNLLGTYKALKKRYGAKTYLLLKDIWPQGPADLGAFKNNSIIFKYFKTKENSLYKNSDFIGCMSPKNVEYLLENNKDIKPEKIEVNPNSIKPRYNVSSDEQKSQIRLKYKVPTDKKVFIYGGNLGVSQGIEFLEECIRSNESREKAFFLIVGTGTKYKRLKNFFDKEKPKNAALHHSLPKKDYELLCSACDVGLVYLTNKYTVPQSPSRILSYMQNGMPVLVAAGYYTDLGDIVQGNDFGFSCDWGDLNSFDKMVNLLLSDPERMQEMGRNAKIYLQNNLTAKHSYQIIMNHFE